MGSHPEISGYSEMNISYQSIDDLQILRSKVRRSLNNEDLNRIVLDKLLHIRLTIASEVLNHKEVSIIFLLRRPEPTFSSILKYIELSGSLRDRTLYAIQYYLQRTKQFVKLADQLENDSLFIESDQIIINTDNVFSLIQKFLGLNTSLSRDYDTFKFTGVPGYGDPSPNIFAGKLINVPQNQSAVDLSPDISNLLQQAYMECRDKLLKKCGHI
jgi:hypothetical protein